MDAEIAIVVSSKIVIKMLGTFSSKEKYRRMARFILPRGTVNYPSMSVFFWERVEKMHACKLISSVVLASLLFGSPVIADPGVVVGSYSSQTNAEAAALAARDKLLNQGLEVRVQVVPAANSSLDRLSKVPARVVVLPRSGTGVRTLLRRIRALGFADAWYLAETGMSVAPVEQLRIAVTSAQPTPTVAPVLQTKQPAEAQPTLAAMPRTSAGRQSVIGQEAGVDLHRLSIQTLAEADVDVVIDGKVDEALWQQFPYYDNMLVAIPALVTPAEYATQMRIFATEKGLYVSSVMEQPPESLVKRYSRRDDFFDRDTFGVTIDASGEALVAY